MCLLLSGVRQRNETPQTCEAQPMFGTNICCMTSEAALRTTLPPALRSEELLFVVVVDTCDVSVVFCVADVMRDTVRLLQSVTVLTTVPSNDDI